MDELKTILEKHGYIVNVFSKASDAGVYLNSRIDGCSVGIGGSSSVEASGAYELLSSHNNVIWHWKTGEKEKARHAAMETDVYITSVNAITKHGEMLSIDASGNRVSSMLYGHKKIYYIIGKNKITDDLNAAFERVRKYCGPIRAKQLNRNTPCVKDGTCHDCSSPDRICNGMSIMLRPMNGMQAEILLVDEEIGI